MENDYLDFSEDSFTAEDKQQNQLPQAQTNPLYQGLINKSNVYYDDKIDFTKLSQIVGKTTKQQYEPGMTTDQKSFPTLSASKYIIQASDKDEAYQLKLDEAPQIETEVQNLRLNTKAEPIVVISETKVQSPQVSAKEAPIVIIPQTEVQNFQLDTKEEQEAVIVDQNSDEIQKIEEVALQSVVAQPIIDSQESVPMEVKVEPKSELAEEKQVDNSTNASTEGKTDTQSVIPSIISSENKSVNDIEFEDIRDFIYNPVPKGIVLFTKITREVSNLRQSITINFYLQDGKRFLLTAKKQSSKTKPNYLISTQQGSVKKYSPGIVGKVRSNFMGTEFYIFDQGQNPKQPTKIRELRKELAIINYDSNNLRKSGPRRMRTLLPEVKYDEENQKNIIKIWQPTNKADGMLTEFVTGQKRGVQYYYNKPPKWSDRLQSYTLNFGGRVTKASVKNFQLISDKDPNTIYLQFGRISQNEFNLDFKWPISPIQAFGIAISSLDYKLACE